MVTKKNQERLSPPRIPPRYIAAAAAVNVTSVLLLALYLGGQAQICVATGKEVLQELNSTDDPVVTNETGYNGTEDRGMPNGANARDPPTAGRSEDKERKTDRTLRGHVHHMRW